MIDDAKKALQDKATGAVKKAKGSAGVSGASHSLERKTTEIVPERWNELHVYSFSINQAGKGGECTNLEYKGSGITNSRHNLTLAPQSISVSTPFAISVMATNKGVLEENNGVVFRTISINGTTGLYPLREVAKSSPSKVSGSFKSFAPKTGQAIDNLIKKIATSAGTSNRPESNINLEQTGYYQFWTLNNFLIQYAEAKKSKKGKEFRLVFNCPKDNISYVVTPVAFDLRRSADGPLMYNYSITLKAWDVTTDKANLDDKFGGIPSKDNIGAINKVLDRLRKSRNTILAASNVLKGVQGDANSVLNVYNQGVLRIKDIIGIAKEIKDMPDIIKNNAQNMFKNNKLSWKDITQDKMDRKRLPNLTNPFAVELLSPKINGSVNPDGSTPASFNEEVDAEAIQVIYRIVDDPTLSEGITIDQLGKMSRSMEEQIKKRTDESLALTAGDIRNHADKLKEVSDNLAYRSGMMNATYASTYGLRIPDESEIREPSEQDIFLAVALEEARDSYLTTLASGDMFDENERDPFNSANGNLEFADRIDTPISAYPVPVNRGDTLEDIAIQYLGDAIRSREIALLNDLIAPYIDEVGFDLNIKNCTGRNFIVNNVEKLTIRQSIRIVGVGMPTTRRTIINIEDIGANEYRITVDGAPDLNQYDASKYPKLYARLPHTVGSGDILLMPSDQPADVQNQVRSTPLTDRLSYAEKVFKVDCALDYVTSDLIVSSSGDIARSYGYQNAIQAIKLIIETERKELFLHPEYGINVSIGRAITTEVYKEITERIRSAIVRDPRFSDALVEVKKEGTAVKIRVEVTGSNGTGRIPLEFELDS